MKGIIIAGTHSGCGKTTVTLGILAALKKKGFKVQPFKAGPDFIDAGLHGTVVGLPSRNLDQWMCGRDYVINSFTRHAAQADIAVIEGVMGLYDGDFSPASLASLLQVKVILVVDGYGMAESAGAVVRGFAEFSDLSLAGVIFNRVASESHYKRLKDSVRDVPVLGYLPRDIDFEIPHRHLGLTIAEEKPFSGEKLGRLADVVIKYIDVDAIIRNAEVGEQIQKASNVHPGDSTRFKLALAYDKAFSFYYEDNLDMLRDAGAEIVRFSLLADKEVPLSADAVYIGGGYPEIHAEALSGNSPMLSSIRAWADAGKPLYAECGGLMYLSKGIRDFDNKLFGMAGVFPFETRMMRKPRLGYREIVLKGDCILGSKGEKYRGHEFHYSEILEDRDQGSGVRGQGNVYSVTNASGNLLSDEGFKYKDTLASYVHIHFGSNERGAGYFADFVRRN